MLIRRSSVVIIYLGSERRAELIGVLLVFLLLYLGPESFDFLLFFFLLDGDSSEQINGLSVGAFASGTTFTFR